MAEKLLLKSRAEEFFDFRQVDISEFFKGFAVDEAQYQKDLERVLKRFGRKVNADTAAKGDTVTLSCVSALPRYNKKHMPVPVGNGLLNADLEAALIGMADGESKTLSVDGSDVTVTVEKIVRTVLPELTDETVAGFGMEGVATVADLRRYCIGRQVERFVLEDENPDMASAFVWQQTAKNSRVVRDPEEVAAAEKKAAKKLAELQALSERESAAAEEDEAECEPDEEEEDGGPVSEELVRTMFLNEIDLAAIGQRMMELRGVCVTADDYRRYIDKLCEACPEKTRSAVEAEHTALDFTVNECANYVARAIDEFVLAQYKEFFTRE